MKQIIDNETGEVIDVEETNEIATKKLYEVGAITEDTADFIEQYLTIKQQYEMFTYALGNAMRDNGIKSWKNELFTATLSEESIQKRIDTDRLKEDGLYDKYLKLVHMKSSLRIKFKKGNE